VIMAEMTKRRWLQSYYLRYQLKLSALMRWFSDLKRGRAEDGTLNMPCTLVFGDGGFSGNMKGRVKAPTVSVKSAGVAVFGWEDTYTEGEYLTTQKDAVCGHQLADVYMTGPPTKWERGRFEAKQAKFDRHQLDSAGLLRDEANNPDFVADGRMVPHRVFAPRPPRAIPSFRRVLGLKYCIKPDCPDAAHRLKCRDVNASRNILAAFMARVFGRPRPAYLCPVPREPKGPKIVYCLPPPPPPPPWRRR